MDQTSTDRVAGGDAVVVRYRRTARDVRDGVRAVRRVRPSSLVSLLVVPVLFAAGALVVPLEPASRVTLLVAAAFIAVLYLLLPWIGPYLRPARWGVGPEHHVELTPAGVRQGGVVTDTTTAWARIDRLVTTPTALVGLGAGRVLLVVPRRRIADGDIERVRAWWEAARAADAVVAEPPPSPALTGPVEPVEPLEQGADSAVTESPDGTLTVVAVLTPERARVIAQGVARPTALVAVALLILACAALLALGAADTGLALFIGLLMALLGWGIRSAPSRVARRLVAFTGSDPVTWTYSSRGLAVATARGRSELPWTRVRDVAVRGDMLVVRTSGVRVATGGPVDSLTPEQLERVLTWVAAGRGTGRPASRLAG